MRHLKRSLAQPLTPKLDQSLEELMLEMTTHEMLNDVRLFDVDMESSALPANTEVENDEQMAHRFTIKPPPKPPRFRKTEVRTV